MQVEHKNGISGLILDKPSLFAQYVIRFFPKSGKLLEIGAGQGQDSRYFARMGYDVTSAYFSSAMMDLAKAKAKDCGLKMRFVQMEFGQKYPFRNESFDIIYAHLALKSFCIEEMKNQLTEVHRIAKPKCIIAAYVRTVYDYNVQDYAEQLEEQGLFRLSSKILKKHFAVTPVQKMSKTFLKVNC